MTVEATPGAPGVQPEGAEQDGGQPEGQGAGLGLYDLSHLDEELRPLVEQELKKVEGNVTKKFTEHADYRKQWEPLEGIEGLRDRNPEELQSLLRFQELMQDPEEGWPQLAQDEDFQEWWEAVGDKAGWFEGGEGEGGPDAEAGGDEPPEWAQGLIDRISGLEEQLGPVSQSVTQQQQQQRVDAANEAIDTELAGLKEKHGDFDVDAVKQLALAYDGAPDSLAKAFADFQRIAGGAQGELVDGKLEQPGTAVTGGQPDTSPEEFTDLNDPALKEAAKRRFAGAR